MTRSLATIGTRARALATLAGRGLMSVLLLLTLAAIAVTFVPGPDGLPALRAGRAARWSPRSTAARWCSTRSSPSRSCARATSSPTSRPARTQPVTHRLISVKHPKKLRGRRSSAPRATTTPTPTCAPFTLDRPTQARYSFSVPYLGWVFVALGTPQMRLFLLVVPALLIALAMLARLWREGGRLAAERTARRTAEHEADEMRGPGAAVATLILRWPIAAGAFALPKRRRARPHGRRRSRHPLLQPGRRRAPPRRRHHAGRQRHRPHHAHQQGRQGRPARAHAQRPARHPGHVRRPPLERAAPAHRRPHRRRRAGRDARSRARRRSRSPTSRAARPAPTR